MLPLQKPDWFVKKIEVICKGFVADLERIPKGIEAQQLCDYWEMFQWSHKNSFKNSSQIINKTFTNHLHFLYKPIRSLHR